MSYKVLHGSLVFYTHKIRPKDKKHFVALKHTNYPESRNWEVPTDLPSIKGQRFLNVSEAVRLLKKAGGYDRGLYRPIYVMAVPLQTARQWFNKLSPQEQPTYSKMFNHGVEGYEDYALLKFDGQKRSFMAVVSENLPTLPVATIYKMETVQAGNKAFNDFNTYMLENQSSESLFINDFLADESKAVRLAKRLEENELVITDKEDFMVIPEKWKEDTSKFRVAHNTWKVANDWFEKTDINEAVKVIQDVLSSFRKPDDGRITISAWFLHGLCKAIEMRPEIVGKPQPREALVASIKAAYSFKGKNQKKMLDLLRSEAEDRKEKDGGIPTGNIGVNTPYIWGAVFLCNLNERGAEESDTYYKTVQNATKLSTLWSEIRQSEREAREKKQKKVA